MLKSGQTELFPFVEKTQKNDLVSEYQSKRINKEIKNMKVIIHELIINAGVEKNPIIVNLLTEYIQVYQYILQFDIIIKYQGLITEHTNKFGATNFVKNPLVAERKNYNSMLIKISNTLSEVVGITNGNKEVDAFENFENALNGKAKKVSDELL